MTNKTKEKMKRIMREIIRKQVGCFAPGQSGWPEHVNNCIAVETCPECGNYLFIDGGLVDGFREVIYSECSACDWKYYNYSELKQLKLLEA